MHLKRSNIWKCIWAISKYSWATLGWKQSCKTSENPFEHYQKLQLGNIIKKTTEHMSKAWKGAALPYDVQICRYIWAMHEKEQLSHMCRHIWKGATWKSRRSFVCSEHVLTEAGAPQTDNIFEDTIFVGYWSICQNLNIIFVGYRSICQNLNIFSNTKRNIARIANAVQVTICLLVSTSVY